MLYILPILFFLINYNNKTQIFLNNDQFCQIEQRQAWGLPYYRETEYLEWTAKSSEYLEWTAKSSEYLEWTDSRSISVFFILGIPYSYWTVLAGNQFPVTNFFLIQ